MVDFAFLLGLRRGFLSGRGTFFCFVSVHVGDTGNFLSRVLLSSFYFLLPHVYVGHFVGWWGAPNVPCLLVMAAVLIHLSGYSYFTSIGTAGQVIHVSPPGVENRAKKMS